MKKFTLTALFLCLTLSIFAQEGFKIGLRFSPIVSFATILDSSKNTVDELNKKARIGISYGLLANYGFSDNYALHTGVHVVTKGYKSDQTVLGIETKTDYRVTTVEIPIALKLRSNEIGNGLHVKGMFGVSADINVAFKSTVSVAGVEAEDRDAGENIIPVGATFIFGPGVEWEFDFGTLDLGVTYHQGLTNLNNKKKSGFNGVIRLNYVALDLGYYF